MHNRLLGDNQVSDLSPLAGVTVLNELSVSNNQVGDLAGLEGHEYLHVLSIDGNQVSSLTPLAEITTLDLLSLTGNQVTDLGPLVENEGIGNGNFVSVDDNPIDEDAQAENIAALCDRGVYLSPFCD